MPNPYSAEMRERVIARVESGASRREAAEHFEISASAAVKWLQRWRDSGSAAAQPRGGSTSPLEKQANWLLGLIAKQPDLTLDEVLAAKRAIVKYGFEEHADLSAEPGEARQLEAQKGA